MERPRLIRVATVPISIDILFRGQLRFMISNGFDVYTVSSDGPQIKDFTLRENVPHHLVRMTRIISPWKDIVALLKLIRLFKELKPDIIHSHTPKAGLLSMIAGAICGVPIRMHTVAGMPVMEATGLTKFLLNQTEKMTYLFAHFVYPNSFALRDYILKNYPSFNKKIRVIANGSTNGIDVSFYQKYNFPTPVDVPEGSFVFVYIGRLLKDKGTVELIQAFSGIYQKQPTAKLILVGSYEEDRDPLPGEIRNSIKNHPGIRAVGFQKDVRPYLSMANAFVFPSWREGFPNVVLQALCMELPVIATDINGCNEMITHGENGFLVPTKSAAALAEKMELLMTNDAVRLHLETHARKSVVEKYDQKLVWNSLLKEYNSLLHDLS